MSPSFRRLALVVLPAWFLGGCATTYLKLAPPSPSEPVIPAGAGGERVATPDSSPIGPPPGDVVDDGSVVQPGRQYGLPELVELAAASNPETRIVWQRARQAALAVGVAHARDYPTLSAVALAAYQRSWFPASALDHGITVATQAFLPGISLSGPAQGTTGHLGLDTYEVVPFLALRWEALDFSRGPAKRAAEQGSVAANLVFVGEHQKLLFQVSRTYFRLGAARAQVKVALEALDRTRTIDQSAEAKFDRGLATAVEVAEARREVAQAEYELSEARASEKVAGSALLTVLGVDPRMTLEIETLSSGALADSLRQPVDSYLQTALASRPDLGAAQAHATQADAMIDHANSTWFPKLSLVGTGGLQTLGAKASGGSFNTATIPHVTALASLEWLLFDGGAREGSAEIARARRDEAQLEIRKLRNVASQEVLSAYDEANAALSRYRAAQALERTAAVADDATARSYANGLSTLAQAASAQKAHSLASAAKERAYAEARIAATALTFASGQLRGVGAIPDPLP
ncbi:MAG: TolC family protein [Myxococcaceae bacterium]|nr:MAG: TolC family protein [Myxococcaceae bacterium]